MKEKKKKYAGTALRTVGLGLITGAADDDCSAIGTYAQVGAQLGYKALWTAPVILPMMMATVYLAGKLGQVTGKGLFGVLRCHYPRSLIYLFLVGVIIGNTIEAGADIGGISAAIGIFLPLPRWAILLSITAIILSLQLWGSYAVIRNIFRILAMSLLGYIGSAYLARPDLHKVIHGTLLPTLSFNKETLSLLVAIVGTSLSAYLYTWQSNEEVEEQREEDPHAPPRPRETSETQLHRAGWDVIWGMLFSNLVMYSIILAAAATLFISGKHNITSASEAAESLVPLAGRAASLLFATGIVGVGFLSVPVMTIGASYDLCQTMGWKNGLHFSPRQAKRFYGAIIFITLIAMGLNFFNINPMHGLVLAGIVQGFSSPPLMFLIMHMTNKRSIMGPHVNGRWINIMGWTTTIVIFAASIGLIFSWFLS
ncbi:MAG TPA: divalent metal cation transporter [Edaphobacter sp.]|nr:divalent metal cation transporter [Edaphobacter sp.]